jgi:hypothetical protein
MHREMDSKRHSDLWGRNGERWDPRGRLPDCSYAGYHAAEAALPTPEVVGNVRDFGAKGDGETEDTEAFRKAIEATDGGALLVPAGRYALDHLLPLQKSRLVLRGEGSGPEGTTLLFRKSLTDLFGGMHMGYPGQNIPWNWGVGGLVWLGRPLRTKPCPHGLTRITTPARRGDRSLEVAAPGGVHAGDTVALALWEDPACTLSDHLHNGQIDATRIHHGYEATEPLRWYVRIADVAGTTVSLAQPLRFDVRPEWLPALHRFDCVRESGVEHLTIEMPDRPYPAHLQEGGYNGIALYGCLDCWVRGVELKNCDSGISFEQSKCCTARDIRVRARSEAHITERHGVTYAMHGHHGISFDRNAADNLLTDFAFDGTFFHDITVNHKASGNVVRRGKGPDLNLDHHRDAPFENLFTDLDVGIGTRLYESTGNPLTGPHSAARETFWNLRLASGALPPAPTEEECREAWSPIQTNVIPCRHDTRTTDGEWLETVFDLQPRDLYEAQRNARLGSGP